MKAIHQISRYYLILNAIGAATAENVTATGESYMPEPSMRGTIGLFWSCAIAFGICVWTAIHTDLNPNPNLLDRFAYKLGWVAIAAFAPEIIIFTAYSQFRRAQKLRDAWNTKYLDTFGLQGGFMVLMGGFTVEPKPGDERVTMIKPAGFCKLMELDDDEQVTTAGFCKPMELDNMVHLPKEKLGLLHSVQKPSRAIVSLWGWMLDWLGYVRMSRAPPRAVRSELPTPCETKLLSRNNPFQRSDINDKGKADGISKFIVSLQALWMVLQYLGRKFTGLPVTLLEFHVLIQILYSVAIYGFWWYKPLDISVPIRIPISQATWDKLQCSPSSPNPEDDITPVDLGKVKETDKYSKNALFTTEKKRSGLLYMWLRVVHDVAILIDVQETQKGLLIPMILAVLNGAIHALAWNIHFPTVLEKWLWRITCITMGVFTFLIYITARDGNFEETVIRASWETRFNDKLTWLTIYKMLLKERETIALHADAKRWTNQNTPNSKSGTNNEDSVQELLSTPKISTPERAQETIATPKHPSLWGRLKFDLACCLLFGYGLSIHYITVESFISMRSVPAGSYKTLAWSQLWPHL